MRNLKTTTLFASKEKYGCLFVYYQHQFVKHLIHSSQNKQYNFLHLEK
jgi:hypothetical protein